MSQSYVSDEEPKDLKQLYNEVDKEIDWPEGTYGGLLRSDQYSDIIRKLRSKIKQRSLQEGLSTDEYENRLWSMLSFVDRLRDALNPPREDDPYKSVRGISYYTYLPLHSSSRNSLYGRMITSPIRRRRGSMLTHR